VHDRGALAERRVFALYFDWWTWRHVGVEGTNSCGHCCWVPRAREDGLLRGRACGAERAKSPRSIESEEQGR
jgi:hypothetical protein